MDEANDWYKNGNGQPLYADLSKIDLSSISRKEFKKIGQTIYRNLLFKGNAKDGLVYGTIGLTLQKNGTVTSKYDDYDFDVKPYRGIKSGVLPAALIIRNLETQVGGWFAGEGQGYRIYFSGSGVIGK